MSDVISENSSMSNGERQLSRASLRALVHAEADSDGTVFDTAVFDEQRPWWLGVLLDLIEEAEDRLEVARRIRGREKQQIVNDMQGELAALQRSWTRLTGESATDEDAVAEKGPAPAGPTLADGATDLQLSWTSGRVVAWAAAEGIVPASGEEVAEMLERSGAPAGAFTEHKPVKLPSGVEAEALSAQVSDVLGWLVAFGAGERGPQIGASAAWLGHIAVAAVELVAQGRVVPRLHRVRRRRNKRSSKNDRAEFSVQWVPGVISQDHVKALADSLPGAVTAVDPGPDSRAVVRATLTGMVDAIVTSAARMLDVPAPPPDPRSKTEVSEAFLAHLGGQSFQAPTGHGSELARQLEQWARPATAVAKTQLIVNLDPPDDIGAWHLKVFAPGPEGALEPVEVALGTGSKARRAEVTDQLTRMERLLPALLRPGGRRRGEVILSQEEAWELMADTGLALQAAGFEVRVPELTRPRRGPSLRLTAEEGSESVVGAQQLTAVRWSAVIGDVELTAPEIAKLALQAKPLVQSRGKWVALDHADLAEAAAALAERADTTELTGAEMLRHALGLEGTPISGGVALAGEGWASDLLDAASSLPSDPPLVPKGFSGELRSYQAEAVAWLGFLDEAGLGGCLALDMGLGKTPTVLAHVGASAAEGPALVVAPPAVVGNWANEAARFAPELKVLVHHGPNRASPDALPGRVDGYDMVITTYGTAVRDIDALSGISWDRLVLDEAQIIKNPTSETAQQLRRLEARSRVALTGTPIENGLGDLWAIMDFTNPGLVGPRPAFISQLSRPGDARGAAESALRALNGVLVFRRTKAEPSIAAELPDRIDELAHCTMTSEQIGLYQAVLDNLVRDTAESEEAGPKRKGAVLAAITALKQICNHPAAYQSDLDGDDLEGRSGKLQRLNEIVDQVFANDEKVLIFTHFAQWGERMAAYLSERTGEDIRCYHGGLARGARDQLVEAFQSTEGAGAMVLSLKAGGTGLNLTAASHVVLYDRWWNPAVEDQARDRVWRIGQTKTVICHRLVCPGTVDERVEEVVQGKRRIADMVLPKSSSLGDLGADQLRQALGINPDQLLAADAETIDLGAGEPDTAEPTGVAS